jgi:quinol monooxygenase YgiN
MQPKRKETKQMFSLTSRIVALPGQRDALAEILLEGSRNMPGCLRYVIAKDPRDESAVWINEVWESETTQRSALSLPQMKDATTAAMRMIAGVGDGTPTKPVV